MIISEIMSGELKDVHVINEHNVLSVSIWLSCVLFSLVIHKVLQME